MQMIRVYREVGRWRVVEISSNESLIAAYALPPSSWLMRRSTAKSKKPVRRWRELALII